MKNFAARRTSVALATAAVLLGFTGCSDDAEKKPSKPAPTATESTQAPQRATDSAGDPVESSDIELDEDGLVGTDCASLSQEKGFEDIASQSTAEFLKENPLASEFSKLALGDLNKKADISDDLADGDVTLVATVNAGVEQISKEARKNLAQDSVLLPGIVRYHVLEGLILPADLTQDEIPTAHGAPTAASKTDAGLTIDTALIRCGGMETTDGVVYLVNTLMLPPAGLPGDA